MKTKHKQTILTAALATLLTSPLSLLAQDRYSIPADPNLKYSTPIAPGVAVPDKIESSIGTLNLTYGYPSADTVEKIYDNLDRSRALQAYLMAIPVVNQAGMRDSLGPVRPGQPNRRHLGKPRRSAHRRAHRQRQHDLQLHLDRHQERSAGP